MNYTPKQRLKIYEVALTDYLLHKEAEILLNSDYLIKSNGLCPYFKERFGVFMRWELPEIMYQEPTEYNLFWFAVQDFNGRIRLLQKAINEVSKLIK